MNKIKSIAMYLPQFHSVPENDKWWGEGFTEWVAAKNSVPLFEGHNQPRIPLNRFYYNLMDKSTMEWQNDLRKKYCIDGFCFYHYWFEDGKRILEKPAENLLQWKDIDMPFCFSWANESWVRTWSNIENANIWTEAYESRDGSNDGNGVLLKQGYGREKAWKQHFEYLLPFFRDDRYIKIQEKPVFIIYRPMILPCLNQMLRYWNKLAVQNQLPGIYVIGTICSSDFCHLLNATLHQEPPMYVINTWKKRDIWKPSIPTKCFTYEALWQDTLTREYSAEKPVFLCAVNDCDTTPRKGKNGSLLLDASPEKFKKYFKLLVDKSVEIGNELIFINAWNEWGEGMYLEPDEKNGYGYLEAVRDVMIAAQRNDLL